MKSFVENTFGVAVSWIVLAFVLWLSIAGIYGAGNTPVEESPFYNTPEQEMWAVTTLIPIVSLILSASILIILEMIDRVDTPKPGMYGYVPPGYRKEGEI